MGDRFRAGITSRYVTSQRHLARVAKSSTSFAGVKAIMSPLLVDRQTRQPNFFENKSVKAENVADVRMSQTSA